MLKMANQQIQRIGAEMVKVLFMIEVKKIEFADDVKSDYSKSTLSLSFERGGKLASTKDRILEPEKNILYVNETLSLIVTLYKQSNSHGKFQEKLGKLTLRQLKKNKRIVSSNNDYKGVGGSIKLPIHKLVSELSTGGTKDMVYPIDAGKDILVHVRLSARLIGDANDDDDMSMISDSSNHSGLATNSGHLLSSGSAGGNDDDDGSNNNIGQDNAHRQPPKINGSQSKLQTSSSNNDLSESANGSPDRKIASRRVTNPPVGPHLHAHGSSVEQRAEFLQLMSKLHDRDAEIARLQERLQEQERDHRAQILALRTELGVAQGELKRLQLGRSAVEIANEKADGVLAAALARAREETASIAEEYAGAAAELLTRDDELIQCRAQLDEMTLACEQERQTSLGAAALASASAQRRAELEDENAQLLDSLINTKVQFAETSQRYEEDKRKVWTMKRRLQRYATRVASLEVAETLRSQNFVPPRVQSVVSQPPSQRQQAPVQVRQPMQLPSQQSNSQPQSRQLQSQQQPQQPVRSASASTSTGNSI